MKMTIDIPSEIIRELKLRAVESNRKLKDTVADALEAGLASPRRSRKLKRPVVRKSDISGLPVITNGRRAARGKEVTPKRIAQILLDQEVEWLRESA